MKSADFKIETPRGTMPIHTIYDSLEEAREEKWGIWFYHNEWIILSRDNRVGAVVPNPYHGLK